MIMDYSEKRFALVRELHDSPTLLSLAVSGGGTLVISELLAVPGGSRTVLEAAVPYTHESLARFVGRIPDQYCCTRTARQLAMAAFDRGLWNLKAQKLEYLRSADRLFDTGRDGTSFNQLEWEKLFAQHGKEKFAAREAMPIVHLDTFQDLIGVGCSASLVTDREKKGDCRVHVAVQTLNRTMVCSLVLAKDARTRAEEERLVADLIFNLIFQVRDAEQQYSTRQITPIVRNDEGLPVPCRQAFLLGIPDTFRLEERLPLSLKEGETIETRQTAGSQLFVDIFFGNTVAVLWRNGEIEQFKLRKELPTAFSPNDEMPGMTTPKIMFPGSFSPIHEGHLEMIRIAERRMEMEVALELSMRNIEKPPIDFISLEDRLRDIDAKSPGRAVWVTQAPTYAEKARLFPGSTYIIGADTLKRIADLKHYRYNLRNLHDMLRGIAYRKCRFLVYARRCGNELQTLETLEIPDMLRSLCDEVPASEFVRHISSNELRKHEF